VGEEVEERVPRRALRSSYNQACRPDKGSAVGLVALHRRVPLQGQVELGGRDGGHGCKEMTTKKEEVQDRLNRLKWSWAGHCRLRGLHSECDNGMSTRRCGIMRGE